jgi:hypothetical protein
MPPVDRLNPIRAGSSESSFSLMEFMREFPNDEACLDYLWRTRHAPDGKHAHCPKCDQRRERSDRLLGAQSCGLRSSRARRAYPR